MTYTFSEEEFGETNDGPTEDVVSEIMDVRAKSKSTLSEVERRLEIASCYKAIMQGGFFSDDSNGATSVVEKELYDFCENRLEVLMGIKQEHVLAPTVNTNSIFSEEEIKALKAIAAKLLGKPSLLVNQVTPAPTPTIKKTSVPTLNRQPGKNKPASPQGSKEEPPAKQSRKKADKPPVPGKIRSTGGVPMPTGAALSMVTQQKALESVDSAVGNSPLLQRTIEKITT